jgi:hypothetical protein
MCARETVIRFRFRSICAGGRLGTPCLGLNKKQTRISFVFFLFFWA